MRYRALDVYLGPDRRRVGLLFQYGLGAQALTRLVPDEEFWLDSNAPVFSRASLLSNSAARKAFVVQSSIQPFFNGERGRLPAFFQNLLPEGPLKRHLEQVADLDRDDYFGLLSTCGNDLPGAVYVEPASLNHDVVARAVTQSTDALEMSVAAKPLPGATSLSGVQPKLSLMMKAGGYVASAKDTEGVHFIAKLPPGEPPMLPQVEELSLRLAQAAGVTVCEAHLAPLDAIQTEPPFTVGNGKEFLAVKRFDRDRGRRVHCEDFAQILGIQPEQKYTHPLATYSAILRLLMAIPELGSDAAYELVRRLVVNDMLGNFDAHVKNFGLTYRDGRTPALSPAYDVVAYACYLGGRGHALAFTPHEARQPRFGPALVRDLCNAVPGLLEPKVKAVVRDTVRLACERWPEMIDASTLHDSLKLRLSTFFRETPVVVSYQRRARKTNQPYRDRGGLADHAARPQRGGGICPNRCQPA